MPSEHIRLNNFEQSIAERDQQKRRLLNEIAELRIKVGTMRIEMEQDYNHHRYSESQWLLKFDALQDEVASKIEQLSSSAEAQLYRHRGHIQRPPNPTGGFLNPLLVDICIHDLEHLKNLIQDY
jgi:hypothetical protein